jgi:hypothetical protein
MPAPGKQRVKTISRRADVRRLYAHHRFLP